MLTIRCRNHFFSSLLFLPLLLLLFFLLESAVRITHVPTGTVAACQAQRSQHRNKAAAMELLRAKLAQRVADENAAVRSAARGEQKSISWGGQQARSYVLTPYQLVKDHRFVATSPRPSCKGGGSQSATLPICASPEIVKTTAAEVSGHAVGDLLEGGEALESLLSAVLQSHAAAVSETAIRKERRVLS